MGRQESDSRGDPAAVVEGIGRSCAFHHWNVFLVEYGG